MPFTMNAVKMSRVAIAALGILFAAEFDANKLVKLTGVVTKVEWLNPHTWFYIDVNDETGKVTNWGPEMGSPNGLMRAGWTRNSLKVGDIVTWTQAGPGAGAMSRTRG